MVLATDPRTYPNTPHEVTNEPGAFVGVNVFDADVVPRSAVEREGAGWIGPRATRLGAAAGDPVVQVAARRAAEQHLRQLAARDRRDRDHRAVAPAVMRQGSQAMRPLAMMKPRGGQKTWPGSIRATAHATGRTPMSPG